jgi:hypothetical protein
MFSAICQQCGVLQVGISQESTAAMIASIHSKAFKGHRVGVRSG